MAKKRRRAKKRRKGVRGTEELPRGFTSVFEHWARIASDLGPNPDLASEVEQRRRRLASLLAPYDAVAFLGQFLLSQFVNPDAYVESERSEAAYMTEVAAAVFAYRAGQAGSRSPSPPIDANVLTPARNLLAEIVLLEGLRRYRQAGAVGTDPLAGVRGRAAVAHLIQRHPGWPWQESAVLLDLFARFATELRHRLGFDATDAVACSEAATELVQAQMRAHMVHDETRRDEVLSWADKVLSRWQDQPDTPLRDRALGALWALMHAGDAMLLTPDALAARANVDPDVAHSYLDALSTPFGQAGDFFHVAESVRFAPYMRVGPNAFLLTVPGNDLWALRLLFEKALKSQNYSKHRGAWLERHAIDMLSGALSPDEVHLGVEIFDGERKIGEIDGLLRFGDAVVVVEAKAATLRPGARRGGEALISHLRETLTKAAAQTSLALRVLHGEERGQLKTAEGSSLALGAEVREVHPVLVTLDDLSSVAPSIWEIAESVVLPPGVTIPWTVTRHELDLVCATVGSPIEFIHFLRRRSRLNQLGGRTATEELDWWMLYLKGRLYFEEDDSAQAVRYLSQTDDLDAWVLYERGLRKERAPKPTLQLERATQRFLKTLTTERPPGWVAAGCAILNASGESGEGILRQLRDARRRARQRDNIQRGMYCYDDGPEPMLICWVAVSDHGAHQLSGILREYVSERLEEHGVRRVLGIGLTASSRRAYDALLVLEQSRWTLPGD